MCCLSACSFCLLTVICDDIRIWFYIAKWIECVYAFENILPSSRICGFNVLKSRLIVPEILLGVSYHGATVATEHSISTVNMQDILGEHS